MGRRESFQVVGWDLLKISLKQICGADGTWIEPLLSTLQALREAYPDCKETFYKVRNIIDGRKTTPTNKKRIVDHEDFPLRNLIKCSCGSGFTGGWCKGRNKHYSYYWCANRNHKAKFIRTEKMDEGLKENLKHIKPAPEAVDLFLLILATNYEKRIGMLTKRKKTADNELARLKLELRKLVRGYVKGKYSKDVYEEVKQQISDEIMAARIVKNESLINKYDLEGTSDFIRELLMNLPKAYEVSDFGQKQVLIGSIYPKGITFHKGKLLNRGISPIFREIRDIKMPGVSLRVDYRTLLELISCSLRLRKWSFW